MVNQTKTNHNKYSYYLMQCNDCGCIYETRFRRGKYCSECKHTRDEIKFRNSINARKLNKLNKEDSE